MEVTDMTEPPKKIEPMGPSQFLQGLATREQLLAWAYWRTEKGGTRARDVLDACIGDWTLEGIEAACRRFLKRKDKK
jgi:hypothetical protein